jgi:hypothetical protein
VLYGCLIKLSAIIACTVLAIPGRAAAESLDTESTSSYLHDAARLFQSAADNLNASKLAADHVVAEIQDQCPNVLTDAPIRDQGPLETEVLGAVYAAFDEPDHQAQRKYVDLLRRLRWSNHVVARLIDQEARNEAATLMLAVPDVCADARAWANSRFLIIPTPTKNFDRHFEPLLHAQEPQATIHRLLRPLMDKADRRLLRRIDRLQGRLTESLAEGWLPKAGEARRVIGLAPPPLHMQSNELSYWPFYHHTVIRGRPTITK